VTKRHPSENLISSIAWLYHVKGLTQDDISRRERLSRPTVVSYLRLAEQRGIVSVKLDPLHAARHETAEQLREMFKLDAAHVVAIERGSEETLQSVCSMAAHLLPDFLVKGDQLGVSWGKTLAVLAEHVPLWPVKGLVVRQLIGSMANPLVVTAERCTMDIARKLGGECINMNAPAICSTPALARELRKEPIIAEQLANLKTCNKVVFSVSPCTPDTHVVQFKVATLKEIAAYKKRGAVCTLVGRFLDIEGAVVKGEIDDRLMAVSLDDLLGMKGFLVASGKEKALAVLAALRGGYVKRLAVDAALAQLVVRYAKRRP
jgi:deoxyribonucleoside regulator